MLEDCNKILLNIDKKTYLRVINVNDVNSTYLSWLNDYEVIKFTEQKDIQHTIVSIKEYVLEKFNSDNDFLFGIFYFDRHIGNIKLGPISNIDKSAEVSFLIGNKDCWGKGIATKALKRIINFGANELAIRRFNAGYYSNNKASAKIFKKCLFKHKKIDKKIKLFEGKLIDLIRVQLIIEN